MDAFAKAKNPDQKGHILNASISMTSWKGNIIETENRWVVARGLEKYGGVTKGKQELLKRWNYSIWYLMVAAWCYACPNSTELHNMKSKAECMQLKKNKKPTTRLEMHKWQKSNHITNIGHRHTEGGMKNSVEFLTNFRRWYFDW